MLPDLDSLRCFVEAAETLNFRAAARRVGLSPAALGQRVRLLEDQVGVPLFERTTRHMELTAAGLALLPAARATLAHAVACGPAARGELGPAPQEITLGTRHELGLSWLVPALPKIEAALPGATLHVYFGAGQDLEERLRAKQVDAAISSRPTRDPRLESVRLHEEQYVFVGAPALLAEHPFHGPEDAPEHVLVDTSTELPLFRYWRDKTAPDVHIRFRALRFMGTVAASRLLVLRGEGIAVLPRYLVAGDLDTGRLVEVADSQELLPDWFRMLFRADDPRAVQYRVIAEVLRGEPLK